VRRARPLTFQSRHREADRLATVNNGATLNKKNGFNRAIAKPIG
jgi:hypothetical protein